MHPGAAFFGEFDVQPDRGRGDRFEFDEIHPIRVGRVSALMFDGFPSAFFRLVFDRPRFREDGVSEVWRGVPVDFGRGEGFRFVVGVLQPLGGTSVRKPGVARRAAGIGGVGDVTVGDGALHLVS